MQEDLKICPENNDASTDTEKPAPVRRPELQLLGRDKELIQIKAPKIKIRSKKK